MSEFEIIDKIKRCATRKDLDDLRPEIVRVVNELHSTDSAINIQTAFRKQYNKLKRNGR